MPLPSQILSNKFPFDPTRGQEQLFETFDEFLDKGIQENSALILRGYAGTGKTTVVSALVKVLPLFNFKFVLLAPTGRAAKVMSSYAKKAAFTTHKVIYKQVADPGTGSLKFKLQKSYNKNTVFIVDEASMLSEATEFGGQGLLNDLVKYVFENDGNRLLLIGDVAQLPPIGQTLSPALDVDFVKERFGLRLFTSSLTEVMRQEQDSGILENATGLRKELNKEDFKIRFKTSAYSDVFRMTGERMEDGLRYAYDKYGVNNTIVITRSNKSAVQYNLYVRNQIHFFENELDVGDVLMIVRNNYFHVPPDSPAGFLANGDFVEVLKISNPEEMYEFRFCTLTLQLLDYPNMEPFEAKVILDTLYTNTTSLSQEDNRKLYGLVAQDYQDLSSKKELKEALRDDPYLNALQIKFAYAVTCHKSQGGQWDAVFVDQGYLTEEMIDHEYIRWLYTGITRAKKELYLVNFNANFY